MSFLWIYSLVAVAGLLVASYTDLKERIVPNKLNYSLLFLGLVLHAVESVVSSSLQPIIDSFSGALLAFLLAFVFYKIGGWAGGDVKLLAALGALLPFPVLLSPMAFEPGPLYALPLFPLMILINSILVAFPFIMFYVFFKTFEKKELRDNFKLMLRESFFKGVIFAGSLFGFSALLNSAGLPQLLSLPLVAGISFLRGKAKWFSVFLLFFSGFWLTRGITGFVVLFLVGLVVGGFFEALTHGKKALRKKLPVKALEEGMISAELIFIEDGKVKRLDRSLLQKISFFEPGETVVSDLSAGGITVSQISRLRELGVKFLWVKESIPMVPILLLGCIVSLVLGDLFWFALNAF